MKTEKPEKLIYTIKVNMLVHIRNLKQSLSHGLALKKVHK